MINFFEFGREYASIKPGLDKAVGSALASGNYILGEKVAEFEKKFARHIGVKYAVGVNSGTDAVFLALKSIGVGTGDEVITVSHTAVATAAAIAMAGARPVFVDVSPETMLMDPSLIGEKITEKTKAILPVHLYGNAAEMGAIKEIADRHGIHVIEDCAQAAGASYSGKKVGAFGAAGAFSFYPTKNLGAYGDAGLVATNDSGIFERMKGLRQYGWGRTRISESFGVNSRLDEFQAAILLAKLGHLGSWNSARRKLAKKYSSLIGGIEGIKVPGDAPNAIHAYHLYVIRSGRRDALAEHLGARGIKTLVHYPVPVHRQPYYSQFASGASLPITEKISAEVLSLPLHPFLKDSELKKVCSEISSFYKAQASQPNGSLRL